MHTHTSTNTHTHKVLYANRNRICSTLIQFGSSFYRTRRTAEPKWKHQKMTHTNSSTSHTHTHTGHTHTHRRTHGAISPVSFLLMSFKCKNHSTLFTLFLSLVAFPTLGTWCTLHFSAEFEGFSLLFFLCYPPPPYPLSIFPAFSFIFLLVAHRWPNSFPDFFSFFFLSVIIKRHRH